MEPEPQENNFLNSAYKNSFRAMCILAIPKFAGLFFDRVNPDFFLNLQQSNSTLYDSWVSINSYGMPIPYGIFFTSVFRDILGRVTDRENWADLLSFSLTTIGYSAFEIIGDKFFRSSVDVGDVGLAVVGSAMTLLGNRLANRNS